MLSGASYPRFNILDLAQRGAVEAYIEPFKSLRLRSLQLNPEAYTSTYEEEALFAVDVWEGRLKNPLASTIVAAPAVAGAQLDWVGMVTLLGPVASGLDARMASTSPDERNTAASGDIAQYRIVALFTMPSVRRLGLGENLVRSAIDLAKDKERMRRSGAVRVDVMVDSRNLPAKCMYEKCGFVVVGESDISSPATQGEPVPDQLGGQQRRIALNMEQYILLS